MYVMGQPFEIRAVTGRGNSKVGPETSCSHNVEIGSYPWLKQVLDGAMSFTVQREVTIVNYRIGVPRNKTTGPPTPIVNCS